MMKKSTVKWCHRSFLLQNTETRCTSSTAKERRVMLIIQKWHCLIGRFRLIVIVTCGKWNLLYKMADPIWLCVQSCVERRETDVCLWLVDIYMYWKWCANYQVALVWSKVPVFSVIAVNWLGSCVFMSGHSVWSFLVNIPWWWDFYHQCCERRYWYVSSFVCNCEIQKLYAIFLSFLLV